MSSGPLSVRAQKRLSAFQLDLTFTAAAEGVTVLFGPSGAGKSQTLALVAGASRPQAGRIALGDKVLFDSDRRFDLPPERRRIGWVFQDGRLFPHMSVRANLDYGARRAARQGREASEIRFDDVVETLGIAPLLQRRPTTLSGGERQRVAIGRALLSRPDLLLMDEPLAALDLARRMEILPYLERLKGLCGLPILYVTHALAEVVRLADRIIVLEAGRVLAEGPLSEVLTRADLPFSARPDAIAVLSGVVIAQDVERGLTRIQVGDDILVTPRLGLPPGAPVRAAILARDVLVALQPPEGISARNVLPARIESIGAALVDGVRLVRLRLDGDAVLLCALTSDAVSMLGLAAGVRVHAVVKSVAIEGLSPGGLIAALEA